MERRARVRAALGDPARLAIVDRPAVSDASPGEIRQLLAMPTNLVAHHLGGALAVAAFVVLFPPRHDGAGTGKEAQPGEDRGGRPVWPANRRVP